MENPITAHITSTDELAVFLAQISDKVVTQIGPEDVAMVHADVIGFLLALYIKPSDDQIAIANLVEQIKQSADHYRLARAEVGGHA